MNFLLDCFVEDVNDKNCMFDYTNGHLRKKCPSDLERTTLKETRVNADLVSLAKALNGEGNNLFLRTESYKTSEVSYTTIEDALEMHLPIEEGKLKQLRNDDMFRRSRPLYKNAIKNKMMYF
jgi:hypothetical protein